MVKSLLLIYISIEWNSANTFQMTYHMQWKSLQDLKKFISVLKKVIFLFLGHFWLKKFHYTLLNLDENCITSELLYLKFSKNLKKANFEVHKYFNTFLPSKYNVSNVSFSIISDIKNHL